MNTVTITDEEKLQFKKYYNYSFLAYKIEPPFINEKQAIVNYMNNFKDILIERYKSKGHSIKISIIMPTFNRQDIIENAIKSILNQSYKNWELLIVDDFSNDNTENIINKYLKDSRIKYIRNKNSKGASGARNTGLNIAEGKYVAYLDTDNDWDKDYLLLVVNTLEDNPEYDSLYTAQNIFEHLENEDKLNFIRFGVFSRSILENRNYIDINCYVHKLELVNRYGGFDEKLQRLVDWDLIFRYAKDKYPYALPCIVSNYYLERSVNQLTSKSNSNYRTALEQFTTKLNTKQLKLKELEKLDLKGYCLYSDVDNRNYEISNKKVSIIIPNYEALNCLNACLAAIEKYTPQNIDYEVIIVDNCSSLDVRKYLEIISKSNTRISIIQNNHNMGFTYAVNQGIRKAQKNADIILMNNDAIVTENWLNEMYRVKDEIDGAGLIVPRQVLLPKTNTMTIHVPLGVTTRELDVNVSMHHQNVKDIAKYNNKGYIELNFAPFFLVMITKECFDILGYLDEENGRHYKSDRLYCNKALNHNIKIIYTPYSKAYHLLKQSTDYLKKNDKKMYEIIYVKNNWDDMDYNSIKK